MNPSNGLRNEKTEAKGVFKNIQKYIHQLK